MFVSLFLLPYLFLSLSFSLSLSLFLSLFLSVSLSFSLSLSLSLSFSLSLSLYLFLNSSFLTICIWECGKPLRKIWELGGYFLTHILPLIATPRAYVWFCLCVNTFWNDKPSDKSLERKKTERQIDRKTERTKIETSSSGHQELLTGINSPELMSVVAVCILFNYDSKTELRYRIRLKTFETLL